jgi:hypothetical protein
MVHPSEDIQIWNQVLKELCEAITGCLWSFLVYAGKDTEFDSPLITADTNKITATDKPISVLDYNQCMGVTDLKH